MINTMKKITNVADYIISRQYTKTNPFYKCIQCKREFRLDKHSYYQVKFKCCSQICYNFMTEYYN